MLAISFIHISVCSHRPMMLCSELVTANYTDYSENIRDHHTIPSLLINLCISASQLCESRN